MAVDALETRYFVLHHHLVADRRFLVAGRTVDFSMLAFQRECGLVMVEKVSRPALEGMAAAAVGHAIFFKLSAVYVFVAGRAFLRNIGEAPVWFFIITGMAGGTIGAGVATLQGEVRLAVVEVVLAFPGVGQVAGLAGLIGVKFGGDFALVYIFVTIHTAAADFPKLPFFFPFEVTGKARGGQVCPVEREIAFRMCLNREKAWRKPIDIVAVGAVRGGTSRHKFALVVVRMALSTGIVRQGFGQAFRDVALATIHDFVFALQRKISQIVVELIEIFTAHSPGVLRVAFGAIGAKLTLVDILVTGHAVVRCYADIFLKNPFGREVGGVAAEAVHPFVLAVQREARSVVAEVSQPSMRSERLLGVALFAIVAEVALVYIIVAAVAIGERYVSEFLEILTVAGFHLVAVDALHVFVLSDQGVIRVVVVKFFRWRKCLGRMTGCTVIPQSLLVVIIVAINASRTESEESFLSFFQFPVADEIRDVALPTINFGVGPVQIIARQPVVEPVLVEPYHIELSAVVVAVAFGASFFSHFPRIMVPCSLIEPVLDFSVAIEAFFIGNFLSEHMALRAIGNAFEMCMRLGQVSGRELGHCLPSKQQQQNGDM